MGSLMTYKDYYTVVHFDAEQGYLYGKIEGIADLVTFEADELALVEQSFRDAVDDYLAFCHDIGKAPDRTFKGKFNVRVDPGLHRAAARKAAEQGKSLNQFVEEAIMAAV